MNRGSTAKHRYARKILADKFNDPFGVALRSDHACSSIPASHRAALAGDGSFVVEICQAMVGRASHGISTPGSGGWGNAHVFSTPLSPA